MNAKLLYQDQESQDIRFAPDLISVTLPSGGEKMFGFMFTAAGEGHHPTVVMIHGFPGNECNFDLAHALRRTGWNVFIFHYRGTWGSKGKFSFSNMLEDICTSIDFIRSTEAKGKYRIDEDNIVLAGNSVGGFAALLSTACGIKVKGCVSISSYDLGLIGNMIQKDNAAMRVLRAMFEECVEPTEGSTVDELIDEIIINCEGWNLLNHAEKLAKHNILIVAGSRDDVGPAEIHYFPLIGAICSHNRDNLKCYLVDSDHGFQDKRIQLSELIGEWLDELSRKPE